MQQGFLLNKMRKGAPRGTVIDGFRPTLSRHKFARLSTLTSLSIGHDGKITPAVVYGSASGNSLIDRKLTKSLN